jgi:hypothetical protein
MNNFIVAVQNELNFNKVLETHIAQLAATLPHPNGRDFPGQPAIPIRENVKACHTLDLKSTEPKPPYVCPGCLITHIATI